MEIFKSKMTKKQFDDFFFQFNSGNDNYFLILFSWMHSNKYIGAHQ